MTHRYIARIIIGAETGLFAGSGENSLLKDALVQKDHAGLPMIQGTSLTGVLRHSVEKFHAEDYECWKNLFGFQELNTKTGRGSRLRVSSAYMLLNNSTVSEGLTPDVPEGVLAKYTNLPVRQHVRINDKGVAENRGLFDNEIVYKGTRFMFEMELHGTENDAAVWNKLIKAFYHPLFRIGQGTRKGYGKLKIHEVRQKILDLRKAEDFNVYLAFDPQLNAPFEADPTPEKEEVSSTTLVHYTLKIEPDRFFLFGAGGGDDEADQVPVTEEVAGYEDDTIRFRKCTLIPASSVKGALAHRTAFYYNKLSGQFSDKGKGAIGSDNEAVAKLFGTKTEGKNGQRGRIILNDIFYDDEVKTDKIFNHVAIDRFTGGAMEGALFSEKTTYFGDSPMIHYDIFVESEHLSPDIITSFEDALTDVCKGLLPLGGMTTKGHGIFTGELLKDGESIFNYKSWQ